MKNPGAPKKFPSGLKSGKPVSQRILRSALSLEKTQPIPKQKLEVEKSKGIKMILVIGMGSMGQRRVRCLQSLGYKDIIGIDPREDRCRAASEKYGIQTTKDVMFDDAEAIFISTPPKFHRQYSELGNPQNSAKLSKAPMFIEAGTELLEHGMPSATMLFNPLVKIAKEKLSTIGKLINITYHCGQYLPDWHPYEKVSEFYAAEAACREIVAFELMWMTHLFGDVYDIQSHRRRGGEIEGLKDYDSMAMSVEFLGSAVATIMIDVVSRKSIRQLVINGTERQLIYDLNQGVSEQMYIDEVAAFMAGEYPNTLEHSNRVIEIMKRICG
jgi:predicted dehydrogenase